MRILLVCVLITTMAKAQFAVARDTLTVVHGSQTLQFPFAGGLNYLCVSNADLNFDGIQDLVCYDRCNAIGSGLFKCFIKDGTGQTRYKPDADLPYFFPEVSNWALLLDFNGDQKADLFCSSPLGIQVYKNISTPQNRLKFSPYVNVLMSNYNPGALQPLYTNIYASPIGAPGIKDIDGDGDLDILTFSSQGVFIEWHKNLSIEKFGHKDSLVFELASDCWGKCAESNCQVGLNQCQSKSEFKEQHAGACLTCLDIENDGDQDLLIGDVGCTDIQFAYNNGTAASALISDTTRNFPNYPQKGNTQVLRLQHFPCAFIADVDADGKQDLLASPQTANSENAKSLWYYRNVAGTGPAQFQFVASDFLQSEMIDYGQGSKPLLYDINADGLTDLLVVTQGQFTNGYLSSRIAYYQNTGTAQIPKYTRMSADWLNLSTYMLQGLTACLGDIDADGDVDLILGTASGQIHWFENTASINQAAQFTVLKLNPFAITVPFGSAAPLVYDVNKDQKPDLIVGMRNGKLALYINTGNVGVPGFSLYSSNWAGIDVRIETSRYGLDAYASPELVFYSGQTQLLVGSASGHIFNYTMPQNPAATATLINDHVNFWNEGPQSTIAAKDINADGRLDFMLGNAAGGCMFFSSASPQVGVNSQIAESKLTLFPQPAENFLHLKGNIGIPPYEVYVYLPDGSQHFKYQLDVPLLQTEQWPKGLYVIAWKAFDKPLQWLKCIK
ncbi:MAG: FG-GAP repeat domain-containing protein [Bacteroidia bacterium]